MDFFKKLAQMWNDFCDKAAPVFEKIRDCVMEVITFLRHIWVYVVKLRKIILAVPIGWGAIYLALNNMQQLPKTVGVGLQADGNFQLYVTRLPAVLAPLLITAVCVLLMFCSRRTLTPWMVSLFSLLIPVVLLITNIFPA